MGLQITNEEKGELLGIIRERYGYDFSEYAEASIKRRINRFADINSFENYFDVRHHLANDQNLFVAFILEITVNVTEMFRDPAFFKCLAEKVFPLLTTYAHRKVWHAGCSTGEEVYSLAILLKENSLYRDTIIYATDINTKVVKQAREGVFPLKLMKEFTANYLKAGGQESLSDYYTADYDSVIMNKSLKKNMVFSTHNLAGDTSFNEFQMIICRNVLIYFNQELQDKVLQLFYESLCMFGFLALGSKESITHSKLRDKFEVIDKNEKIFRKIA